MKLQKAEKRVSGSHWYVDEDFDQFGFDIVGGLDLEEVRGVVDEEPHLVLGGQFNDRVKNFFDGVWGH